MQSKQTAKKKPVKKTKPKKEDFAEEFGQRKEIRQEKQHKGNSSDKSFCKILSRDIQREEFEPEMLNSAASYLPIKKIANGIIYTKDNRYVKIVEIIPINFLLRSAKERRNIIYFKFYF